MINDGEDDNRKGACYGDDLEVLYHELVPKPLKRKDVWRSGSSDGQESHSAPNRSPHMATTERIIKDGGDDAKEVVSMGSSWPCVIAILPTLPDLDMDNNNGDDIIDYIDFTESADNLASLKDSQPACLLRELT